MEKTERMRIAVLGLGRMGLPIAIRLARSGFGVTGFDSATQRQRDAKAAGLQLASSANELSGQADVLITVLPGPNEVAGVVGGAHGAFRAMHRGAVWLDCTSNDPTVANQLADEAAAVAVQSAAAPMAGGPTAARNGRLRFFVGGADDVVDQIRPVLEAIGGPDAIEEIGQSVANAHTAKLIANLLWFGQVVAVTEALLLGVSMGVSPRILHSTLSRSAGGSVFIDEYLDSLLAGDNLDSFGIDRCVEELDTVVRLAEEHGIPFELSTRVRDAHREALQRFGAVDGELLAARLLEERAGLSLSAPG